jgi:Trypsin-like peptidase domain
MFAQAIRSASRFTFPYVGLRRRAQGDIYSTIGAFLVVNSDGWALTSAHIIEEILSAEKEADEGSGSAARGAGEHASASADDRDACAEHVEIWAVPRFEAMRPRVSQALVRPIADVAVVKLEPFDGDAMTEYPVFRDAGSDPIVQGMSVCRLGYPFHDVRASWDEERNEFSLPPGSFPVPSFALDGIVSRFHRMAAEDNTGEATFIATSTPGLRGQSGGPLLDTAGRVCGLQSHTTHLDLGFDAQFSAGGRVVAERQFLNVGAAAHVNDVRALLDEAGAGYRVR